MNRLYHEIESDALPFIPPKNVEIPESIDWRELGAVTRVKNQGGCGNCYAFSVIGALEGQLFRSTGELIELSEMDLTECSKGEILATGLRTAHFFSSFPVAFYSNGQCSSKYALKMVSIL